jgi:hypothetical protein
MNPITQPRDIDDVRTMNKPRNQSVPNARTQYPTRSSLSSQSPETFLQPEEVQDLTARIRRPAQVKVLRSMGIEHKVRPDGGIAILRAHISKVFDGNPETTPRKQQPAFSPNWLAI